MPTNLIAPCGMNCQLCYGYIRPRNRCQGCRGSEAHKPKSCTTCKIVTCEKRLAYNWDTCAPCDTPCRRLKALDQRYRTRHHMSMLENLAHIREYGMEDFLRQQQRRFTCPVCGGIVCVHRAACPSCHTALWQSE